MRDFNTINVNLSVIKTRTRFKSRITRASLDDEDPFWRDRTWINRFCFIWWVVRHERGSNGSDKSLYCQLLKVLFYYANSFILDFFHFLEKNTCFYTSQGFLSQGDKRCSLSQFDMAHVPISCEVPVISLSFQPTIYIFPLVAQSFVTFVKVISWKWFYLTSFNIWQILIFCLTLF